MQKIIIFSSLILVIVILTNLYYSNQSKSREEIQSIKKEKIEEEPEIIETSLSKEKLYLLINAHRKNNNLSDLKPNQQLENSAELKLNDMINKKYFRHQDIEGDPGWYLIKQVGYNYVQAGENLAFNQTSEWQILEGWINSEEHNQQLLNSKYEDFGLAINCKEFEEYANSGCITVLHLGTD